jgi:hypothetical protein
MHVRSLAAAAVVDASSSSFLNVRRCRVWFGHESYHGGRVATSF